MRRQIIDEVLKSDDPAIQDLAHTYETCTSPEIKKECEKKMHKYVENKETIIMSKSDLKLPKDII